MARQRAYVINLDSRPDRWLAIQENFRDIPSIELVRIPALQGQPGWKYSGLSHQLALRAHANEGHALVLEDDCHVPDAADFNARWPAIKGWLDGHPDDWDIFLGGITSIARPVRAVARELGIVSLASALCAHFVYCNRKAVDKLLAWQPYRHLIYDLFRAYVPDIRILSATPFLALQAPGRSDLEETPTNYTHLFDIARQQLQQCLSTGSDEHISFFYLLCHTYYCRENGLTDNLYRIGMDIHRELYDQLPDHLKLALVNDLATLGDHPAYRKPIREFTEAWLARDGHLLMAPFPDRISRENQAELGALLARRQLGADGSG